MSRDIKAIVRDAEKALLRQEKLKRETRQVEQQIRRLCLEYGEAAGLWGLAPYHLKQVVEARTQRKIAA